MKNIFLVFSILLFSVQMLVALPQSDYAGSKSKESAQLKETTHRKAQRQERRMERFAEKWDRFKTRIDAKRINKTEDSQEVWDDGRFRLGIILLGVAIGLGILSILISLAGLVNFIAGLLALAGVVLIVWSLIEYYA